MFSFGRRRADYLAFTGSSVVARLVQIDEGFFVGTFEQALCNTFRHVMYGDVWVQNVLILVLFTPLAGGRTHLLLVSLH